MDRNHHKSGFLQKQRWMDGIGKACFPTALFGMAKPSNKKLLRLWWIEGLSLSLVAITYVAMVITIYQFQDQPIPQWPLGFSLNTLLSVYGTLFKAPMLLIISEGLSQVKWQWYNSPRYLSHLSIFDEASRGPYGAFKLIYKIHVRQIIATLGALTVIFALGIDPFTQAIVKYYSCQLYQPYKEALINRLNTIDSREWLNLEDSDVQIKMLSGWANKDTFQVPYDCATANCTFPIYHSVGVCSTCEDITTQINKTCDVGAPPVPPGMHEFQCHHSIPCPDCYSDESYLSFLTSGFDRYDISDTPQWNKSAAAKQYHMETVASRVSDDRSDIQNGKEPLLAKERNSTGPYGSLMTNYLINSVPESFAARCHMYACVRTYNANIKGGKLSENLLSISHNWSYTFGSDRHQRFESRTVHIDCLSQEVQAHLRRDGYIADKTEWMAWNGTYLNGSEHQLGISISSRDAIPRECTYQFSRRMFLEAPTLGIEGVLRIQNEVNTDQTYNHSLNDTSNLTPYALTHSSIDPLLASITGNKSSIWTAYDTYATSVTNFWRQQNHGIDDAVYNYRVKLGNYSTGLSTRRDSTPAKGLSYGTGSCIHVRWEWLALPSSLLLATIVFFIGLVKMSAPEMQHDTWKSSPLALLWHGLEGPVEQEGAWLHTMHDMEKRSKEVIVRLRTTEKGRRLVQSG